MQTIYLDISNKGVLPTIYAKQGDVGRKFLAIITDNGTIVSGLQSPVFSVWYEGASGSGNYSAIDDRPAVVFDGKNAEVEMIAQMLVNAGEGKMTIVLNDALGKQIGLWNIEYCVEPVAGQGSEEAEDYYTALSETATRAIAAAERAENAAIGFYVDNTLTQEGAAAEAKATGEKIELLQDALDSKVSIELLQESLASKVSIEMLQEALDSKVSTEPTRVDSVDEITESGYYKLYAEPADDAVAFHSVADDENNIYLFSDNLRRTKVVGVWGEWEWVNPPMYLGEEYRTTERYAGKAVYTKLLSLGSVSGTKVTVEANHGINGRIISATASAGYFIATGIPSVGLGTGDAITVFTDARKVYVNTFGEWSSVPDCYALLKYIKN